MIVANVVWKSKTVGTWNLLQAESGFGAGAMAVLTKYERWAPEEVEILVAKTKKTHGITISTLCMTYKCCSYSTVYPLHQYWLLSYVVYGKKPEESQGQAWNKHWGGFRIWKVLIRIHSYSMSSSVSRSLAIDEQLCTAISSRSLGICWISTQ